MKELNKNEKILVILCVIAIVFIIVGAVMFQIGDNVLSGVPYLKDIGIKTCVTAIIVGFVSGGFLVKGV